MVRLMSRMRNVLREIKRVKKRKESCDIRSCRIINMNVEVTRSSSDEEEITVDKRLENSSKKVDTGFEGAQL